MRLRALLVIVSSFALVFPASAAPRGVPNGPGPAVRGEMYASILKGSKVQILVRECFSPRDQRRCMVIPDGLRTAIEDATDKRVRWVYRAWSTGGNFYVLGPIYRVGARASFRYAWSDPAPAGCSGGGRESFRRGSNGWASAASTGYGGCP